MAIALGRPRCPNRACAADRIAGVKPGTPASIKNPIAVSGSGLPIENHIDDPNLSIGEIGRALARVVMAALVPRGLFGRCGLRPRGLAHAPAPNFLTMFPRRHAVSLLSRRPLPVEQHA